MFVCNAVVLVSATILSLLDIVSGLTVRTSYSNAICKDDCAKRGESYFWCNTNDGWDYCSPSPGLDVKGVNCISACQRNGAKYHWCYTDLKKNWERCSLVHEDNSLSKTSFYDKKCNDNCEPRGSDYFWCHTDDGWDYCSPWAGADYTGVICTNSCAKHNGKGYNWCKNVQDANNYCSWSEEDSSPGSGRQCQNLKTSLQSTLAQQQRFKRQLNNDDFRTATFEVLTQNTRQVNIVDDGPIYRVYSRELRNHPGVWVSQYVMALIRPVHGRNPRINFGAEVNTLMEQFDAKGYGNLQVPKDRKGHLVAAQLSGPAAVFNLAPQTPAINNNIGERPGWVQLENLAGDWIRGGCGFVGWEVAINVGPDLNRPIAFRLMARFYHMDGRNHVSRDLFFDNDDFIV